MPACSWLYLTAAFVVTTPWVSLLYCFVNSSRFFFIHEMSLKLWLAVYFWHHWVKKSIITFQHNAIQVVWEKPRLLYLVLALFSSPSWETLANHRTFQRWALFLLAVPQMQMPMHVPSEGENLVMHSQTRSPHFVKAPWRRWRKFASLVKKPAENAANKW